MNAADHSHSDQEHDIRAALVHRTGEHCVAFLMQTDRKKDAVNDKGEEFYR